jgi:hypothetical protein
MNLRNCIAIFCLAIAVNFSCSRNRTFTGVNELTKYINVPENGLLKEKTVGGIKFKLKYLPTDYLVYSQLDLKQSHMLPLIDSLDKRYQNSVTFLLSIGPADDESFDITKYGITNYEEFAKQLEQLCFQAQGWISIKDDNGKEYTPSLVHMENINALEKHRNVLVVFNTKDYLKNNFSFIFSDELFNTGINKFYFKASDINGIPKIILKA